MQKKVVLPVLKKPEDTVTANTITSAEVTFTYSTEASLVLIESLNQSRRKWLTSVLQPFSIETIPGLPPALAHICTPVGTCELEAGPHSFLETTVFEVRYGLQQASRPHELASRSNAGRNYAVPVPSTSAGPSKPDAVRSTLAGPLQSKTKVPPTTSDRLTAGPELIARVSAASSCDPELKRLLEAAADSKATQAELEKLGWRIQLIASTAEKPTIHVTPTIAPPLPTGGTRTKKPQFHATPSLSRTDVLVEFSEKRGERWLLPLDDAVVERLPHQKGSMDKDSDDPDPKHVHSDLCDIAISTIIPPDTIKLKTSGIVFPIAKNAVDESSKVHCHPVTLTLRGASTSTWLAVSRKAKTYDEMRTQRISKALAEVLNYVPQRVYLQYKVPEGEVLDQMRVLWANEPVLEVGKATKRKAVGGDGTARKKKQPNAGSTKPKTQRPLGLQVEVVIPRRNPTTATPQTQQATSTSAAPQTGVAGGLNNKAVSAAAVNTASTIPSTKATYVTYPFNAAQPYGYLNSGFGAPGYLNNTNTGATYGASSSSTFPYASYGYTYNPATSSYQYPTGYYPYATYSSTQPQVTSGTQTPPIASSTTNTTNAAEISTATPSTARKPLEPSPSTSPPA